jgi:hypothetical protein
MQTLTRLACLTVLLGAAAPAEAGSKGTHFLVEPYTGLMINQGFSAEDAVGLEAGGLVAIGGKLRGFPPRFYLYFKASHARFGQEDLRLIERGATACVERSYTRLIGGLRVVVPLFWYLRLNLEIGGGSMFSDNRYSENGRTLASYEENLTVMEFGAGLNLRLFPWLSVGVMYDYTMVAEDEYGDMIATIVGEAGYGSQLGWSHLSATLGFHF